MITNEELQRRLALWEQGYWETPENLDTSKFDFSWRPNKFDRPYIHQFGTQWQKTGGPRFVVPENEGIKYSDSQRAVALPRPERYTQLTDDYLDFDYSWHPDASEPPYTYVFGGEFALSNDLPLLEYCVSDEYTKKFMHYPIVTIITDPAHWRVLIEGAQIDGEWAPHPHDPPYIYVFGNKWNDATLEPTLEYHVPGATDRKYITDIAATITSNPDYWRVLIEGVTLDFSWRPHPHDPPYIYVFGNKWNDAILEPTIEYHVPGATEKKYITDVVASVEPSMNNWNILIDDATIDFSWRPNPHDPPYIYVFGNKWNDAILEPTIEYHVPGATEKKYITDVVAVLPQRPSLWTVENRDDFATFDFSWRPHPHNPPQTYKWWENNGPIFEMENSIGTVHMNRDETNTLPIPRYYITTSLEDLINEHPTEVFWALNQELVYEHFDFTWRPSRENYMHVNVFGNRDIQDSGTYYVNAPLWTQGSRALNYIEDYEITIETDMDMYYIVRGSDSTNQYERLKQRFPNLLKTRYMNSWVDTINRCIKKSTTKFMWILCSELDYSDFNFDYYPLQWQRRSVTVFGTQWGRWGNTYLVNTETFTQDTQYIKQLEHLSNINYVATQTANIVTCLYDIVYIDYGNESDSLEKITHATSGRNVTVLPYDVSYYNTLKSWATNLPEYEIRSEHTLWVCTSVTNYDNFDFTWTSDVFQREQLHVFASECGDSVQKFGDTFLLNLNVFRTECAEFDQLEEYAKKINYITTITTPRLPHPVIHHSSDSVASVVHDITTRNFPYYELIGSDCVTQKHAAALNLWDSDRVSVTVTNTGASRVYVPNAAIDSITDEVYDYPHIVTVDRPESSRPLDIVFFSNGEPAADDNYQRLLDIVEQNGLPNRVVRSDGIDGRIASQHAAANLSDTSWYFLINAKLRVNADFDFSWQPDRLQRPKHYIFTATNRVNGLEYGHQAIVVNNRSLTLRTVARGLDFTMASPHEVVERNCGVGIYNTDPWTTWRTAFRECIKLSHNTDAVSDERLDTWLRVGNGENGQWSTAGAYDAVEYYRSVNGKLDKLMNTYDWAWLQEYYSSKYR